MNSADWKNLLPQVAAIRIPFPTRRLVKAGGSLVLGVLLAGCAAQPTAEDTVGVAANTTVDATVHVPIVPPVEPVKSVEVPPASVSLRQNWRDRSWSNTPPAAVEATKGSVTPYPGEPESGEGGRPMVWACAHRRIAVRASSAMRMMTATSMMWNRPCPACWSTRGLASWYGGQFHGRLTASTASASTATR